MTKMLSYQEIVDAIQVLSLKKQQSLFQILRLRLGIQKKKVRENKSETLMQINLKSRAKIQEEEIESPDERFFSMAGLWENKDITIDSIRRDAWKE